MYTLLKINTALIEALKYKAITYDNEYFQITNCRFERYIVNYDGEFIGTKYKKFLWFNIDTYDYSCYKEALKDLYYIGFSSGDSWNTIHYIKGILQDAMDTGIFLEEATKLLGLLKIAEANVEEQNQILINLEKKLEDK